MNTNTSLPIAILSFAFTGVFGPRPRHAADYVAPRVVSTDPRATRTAGRA